MASSTRLLLGPAFLAEAKLWRLNRPWQLSVPCSTAQSELELRGRSRGISAIRRCAALVSAASNEQQLGWEEKNLNEWATAKLKELLLAAEPITFPEGSAYVTDVNRCTGDAAMLTLRGKKRVDYSFDILLDFIGKIEVGEAQFELEGTLSLDTSLGELDDLRIDVNFTYAPETLPEPEREHLRSQMVRFLPNIRYQLERFETEIKEFANGAV